MNIDFALDDFEALLANKKFKYPGKQNGQSFRAYIEDVDDEGGYLIVSADCLDLNPAGARVFVNFYTFEELENHDDLRRMVEDDLYACVIDCMQTGVDIFLEPEQ